MARSVLGTPRALYRGAPALCPCTLRVVRWSGPRKPLPTGASPRHRPPTHTGTQLQGRRRGRRAISYSKGRAPATMPPRRRLAPPPSPNPCRMNARAYFDLMDAITAPRTADELETLCAHEPEFAGHTLTRHPHV